MPEVRLHGQKVIPGFLAHTRDPAEERREQRTLIVSGFSIPAPWCDSFRATGATHSKCTLLRFPSEEKSLRDRMHVHLLNY